MRIIKGGFAKTLTQPPCIDGEAQVEEEEDIIKPVIDLFLDSNRNEEKKELTGKKIKIFKDYFLKSNLKKLYPEFLRILWFSSLPCASHPEIISKLSLFKKCEIGSK